MVPFKQSDMPAVNAREMKEIYEKLKTPVKRGPVIKWDDRFTDSATVFMYRGMFYMYFISISKDINVSGYETHIAKSEDLINWTYDGEILTRNNLNRWDSKQCAGYAGFTDTSYGGGCEIHSVNGYYFMPYLAGNSNGYEPDPLLMGLAKSKNPIERKSFMRLDNPILTPHDKDIRQYEEQTLYKSCMFEDTLNVTGYPYVNVYNAKDTDNRERIFLAVSNDAVHWKRYGDKACFDIISQDKDGIISGDPQIICVDGIYVMLYFHYRKGQPAYNTFACSRDLINWNVWDGEPLIKSEFEWENIHAHKPWFVSYNGKCYHFYCAVNDKNERFIAVATSMF